MPSEQDVKLCVFSLELPDSLELMEKIKAPPDLTNDSCILDLDASSKLSDDEILMVISYQTHE